MLYNCIALLNSSSARKSSSPETMTWASPSMAVDKTGKSLGSRQWGGIVRASIQIERIFICFSSRVAWLMSIYFLSLGRFQTSWNSSRRTWLIMSWNLFLLNASSMGRVTRPFSKIRIQIFVSMTTRNTMFIWLLTGVQLEFLAECRYLLHHLLEVDYKVL